MLLFHYIYQYVCPHFYISVISQSSAIVIVSNGKDQCTLRVIYSTAILGTESVIGFRATADKIAASATIGCVYCLTPVTEAPRRLYVGLRDNDETMMIMIMVVMVTMTVIYLV